MSGSFRTSLVVSCWGVVIGCGGESESPRPYAFLGIPEEQATSEGPAGLIGGQAIRVAIASKVREVPLSDYKWAKQDSRIVAVVSRKGFVYWAVKKERDVPFENATAWVTILERFKSRLE